jgi:hypothetical protein
MNDRRRTGASAADLIAPLDLALALAIAVAVALLCRPYLDATFMTLRDTAAQTPDEGTILYDAARMARGEAPYREVFNFRGVYAFLPYIAAFKIGEPSAHTGRLVQFGIVAAWSGFVYLLALAVTRRRSLALVVASWPFFVGWPAWPYAYPDFSAQLASVAAALAVVVAEKRAPATARWWVGAAGALGGVAASASLAQGAAVLVALAGGLALQDLLAEDARAAVRRQRWYWSGFLAATTLSIAWLLPHGAVRDAVHATLVFPFKYYRSEANVTTYAYDAHGYLATWAARGRWVGWAARACVGGLLATPAVAVAVALLWISQRVVRGLRLSFTPLPTSVFTTCALAGPAIPVLLSRTRSDVCHIGFVVVSCVFVLALIVARATRSPRGLVRAASALGVLALLVPPLGGAGLYAYAVHKRVGPGEPIDAHVRASLGLDLYEARLRPGETWVATPIGGWYYLGTRHDDATSFSLLYEDPYCRGQWAVAAKQIAERKPAFLAMSETIFNLLAGSEPRLRELYFGSGGNYLIDRAEPGPPLVGTLWELSRISPDGATVGTMPLVLTVDGHLPRLLGNLRGGALRAALYGRSFSLFDDTTTYLGTLSDDGRTIEGRVFLGGAEVGRFRAVNEGGAVMTGRSPPATPESTRRRSRRW